MPVLNWSVWSIWPWGWGRRWGHHWPQWPVVSPTWRECPPPRMTQRCCEVSQNALNSHPILLGRHQSWVWTQNDELDLLPIRRTRSRCSSKPSAISRDETKGFRVAFKRVGGFNFSGQKSQILNTRGVILVRGLHCISKHMRRDREESLILPRDMFVHSSSLVYFPSRSGWVTSSNHRICFLSSLFSHFSQSMRAFLAPFAFNNISKRRTGMRLHSATDVGGWRTVVPHRWTPPCGPSLLGVDGRTRRSLLSFCLFLQLFIRVKVLIGWINKSSEYCMRNQVLKFNMNIQRS